MGKIKWSRRRKIIFSLLVWFVVLLSLSLTAVYYVAVKLGIVETSFNIPMAAQFIAKLTPPASNPGTCKQITLPAEFYDHVRDRSVYIEYQAGQSPSYLFITARSKGSNMQGYLFTPNAAGIAVGQTVDLMYPDFSESGPLGGAVPVTVDKNLGQNWLHVSFSLD